MKKRKSLNFLKNHLIPLKPLGFPFPSIGFSQAALALVLLPSMRWMGCSVGRFLASCFGTCYCCLWTGLLGLDSRGTVERQRVWYENDERNDMTRSKWQESGTKLSNNQFARLGQGACTSLFIVGV
jgi:hypothetical protein